MCDYPHVTQGGADMVSHAKPLAGRADSSTMLSQMCGTEPQVPELGKDGFRGNSGL